MFSSIIRSFWPNQRVIRNDIARMNSYFKSNPKEFIDLKAKELDLLAYETPLVRQRGIGNSMKVGFLRTIYHEVVGQFAYRIYHPDVKDSILSIKDYKYNYFYRFKKNEILIYIDGDAVAKLTSDHKLYSTRGKLIGFFDKSKASHPALIIGDTEYGIFNIDDQKESGHRRALQILLHLPENVLIIFKAVAFLYLIELQTDL